MYGNAYEAQDAMRDHIRSATTVICMATMLHTIATGNMTPSYRVLADGTIRPVYFYCVDIAEFAVNKLVDRGSSPAAASSQRPGLHRQHRQGLGLLGLEGEGTLNKGACRMRLLFLIQISKRMFSLLCYN